MGILVRSWKPGRFLNLTSEEQSQAPLINTCISITIVCALLVLGGQLNIPNPANLNIPWLTTLTRATGLEQSCNFVIGICCSIGMLYQILFTSFGMSELPVAIFGKPLVQHKAKSIDTVGRLFHVQNQIKGLEESKKKLSKKKGQLLVKLKEDERVLKHRLQIASEAVIDSADDEKKKSPSNGTEVRHFSLKAAMALLAAFVSFMILLSILLTHLDKSLHSCGYNCRYLLQIIYYWTPIDLIMISAGQVIIS